MTLPPSVSATLLRFGAPAETIAWADDLYRHLGPPVVDALRELVEAKAIPLPELRPEHLEAIRPMLGERYLRQHHPGWAACGSSPAFWCERSLEGVARGVVTALGDLESGTSTLVARVGQAVRQAGGDHESPPRGLLLVSQNAHRGNQEGTLAFDLVPKHLSEALALNGASGRHHTIPGSIGETSGRVLADSSLAVVWEVQPNVYKPAGERNREAAKAYRRYRAWPLVTATAALLWLVERGYRVFVLKGEALRATHEVNPLEPLSPEIERLHDLTLSRAAASLGLRVAPLAADEAPRALAGLAKVNLGRAIEERGLHALVQELRP